MTMQKRYVLSVAAAAALVTAACEGGRTPASPSPSAAVSGSVGAQASKVDVCHVEGNGSFHFISVNNNALSAHLAHGDAQPGNPVPGVTGKQFDAECNQVDVTCPCWDATTLPAPRQVSSCDARFLPTQFSLDSIGSAGRIRWGLDTHLGVGRCFAKGAIAIGPVPVTPGEFAACLALLQPLCPSR